jgi:hypothetical protein
MAWLERDATGYFSLCLRIGTKRFKRSLQTKNEKHAELLTARVEENLLLVERGRLEIPQTADVVTFLLSDGRLQGAIKIPENVTLRALFSRYFAALPEGSLEPTSIRGMKVHQKNLENHFGETFSVRMLTANDLQEFIQNRSKDRGIRGFISASTIKKEIATYRTVWNWGATVNLVEGRFPCLGLKYRKTDEKPPFMPFAERHSWSNCRRSDRRPICWRSAPTSRCEVPPELFFERNTVCEQSANRSGSRERRKASKVGALWSVGLSILLRKL